MSTNTEESQINPEHALHDVMDIVCKYAHFEDLNNIAKVCRSWRYAALREKRLRAYRLQWLPLPYQVDNLTSRLHALPSVSLLFYSSSMGQLVQHDFEEELLDHFEARLPNTKILVGVDDFCHLKYGSRCDILGLFLPSKENQIRINVAYWDWEAEPRRLGREDTLSDRIGEKLGLYSSSCVRGYSRLVKLGKRAQWNGKEITLASICVKSIAMTVNNPSKKDKIRGQYTVILRISGPGVESWSTFIHFKAQKDEIERKLRKLKEKVKRKQNNIGLVYARKCPRQSDHTDHPCGNSRELMRILKCFFPDIQFTMFCESYYYDCNTSNLLPNDYIPDRRNRYIPDRPNYDNHWLNDDIPDWVNDYFPDRPNTLDRFDENDVFKKDFLRKLPDYVSILIISY